MAETNRAAAGGTPEILRRRRDNIQRNAVQWNALGLPGANGSSSGAGGGSLLSGAITGNRPGSDRGGGGSGAGGTGGTGGGDGGAGAGGGGGGGDSLLAPLGGLMKEWPGRGEQITELAGLIGEVREREGSVPEG